MILVTGAGGKTGRTIIKSLSKVENVCALVYREEHVSIAKSFGAEKIIVGDMHYESAIRSAMQGVRSIYHICPNMNPEEVGIGKLIIDSALKSGVGHFVYHSVLHPQTEKMNHHWQKMRVEEMVFESGLPFTILQPAPYMQNLLANWKSFFEDGVLRVPYSVESKFSFIDLEDVAEAAKIVLTEPNHRNAVYELAGISPMSHVEVAEILGHVLKCEVHAEKEEIQDWKSRVTGMTDYAIENLVRMFEYYHKWGLVGNPNMLKWILRREPNSFEKFIYAII
ncbi:MAG: NmrA family NAD(P)-binding protein [Anaerolineales bacterium]|nr:NmrA family NAD(P)-binding protein [Anaerolineales bacterium]